MSRLEQALIDSLANSTTLLIIGSGVSVGVTQNTPCSSWGGLLRDGVEHAIAFGFDTEAWADETRRLIASNDTNCLVQAADRITTALGGVENPEYGLWLEHSIGSLESKDPTLLEKIAMLGTKCLIATTNYDSLLDQHLELETLDWTQPNMAERFLDGSREGIFHLHGCWQKPSSVVLGLGSYIDLAASEITQHWQKVLYSTRSLVFIGCGQGGLLDPNIGRLLEWGAEQLASANRRHFILVRESEVDAIKAELVALGANRIFPVSYGEDYNDLAPFLDRIARAAGCGPSATQSGVEIDSGSPSEDTRSGLESAEVNTATHQRLNARTKFGRRLGDDWEALCNQLEIPDHARADWTRGTAGNKIWAWLEQRQRLEELTAALMLIDRDDLVSVIASASRSAGND